MASPNVFSQYLQAPRTVNDYMADLDRQDMSRLQIENARGQNALLALTRQQQADAARTSMEDRSALRQYAGQSGGDTNKLVALLRASGSPGLMTQADGLEKGLLDRRNTESQISERDTKTGKEQFGLSQDKRVAAITRMAGFQSPEDVRASLVEAVRNGEIGMQDAQRVLATVPQDPAQLAAWQIQTIRNVMSAKDQMEDQRSRAGQAETVRHNRTTEGLTARGQNLTDARAREGNEIKRAEVQMGGKPPPGYRWAGDGRLEAIPGGPGDKLPEAQQKQVVGTQNLSNAITEYRGELANWSKLKAMSPSARAAMGTKYNNMMLQAKEAYNLGVLNGPDYDILTSVITDPRSLSGAITPNTALDKQASELDRIMGGIAKTSGNRRPQDGAPDVAAGKGGQPKAAGAFADPDKEARYQAWKAQQGRQ